MAFESTVAQLSDRGLLAAVSRAAADERHAAVELLRLDQGALTMTTLALLRPHLTGDNHDGLLQAARHKTRREVEEQIARLAPKPDARPVVRRLPAPVPTGDPAPAARLLDRLVETPAPGLAPAPDPPAARLAPLAENRYLLRVTISAGTQRKLRQAQDLLRHTIPTGDHAAILDRALTLLVDQLERQKFAQARRVRSAIRPGRTDRRHIPAAVRRDVWRRDGGRCAFEGPQGRCRETGRLEFHHLVPFADGGATDSSNLALRCRAHNAFESEQLFGPSRLERPDP